MMTCRPRVRDASILGVLFNTTYIADEILNAESLGRSYISWSRIAQWLLVNCFTVSNRDVRPFFD